MRTIRIKDLFCAQGGAAVGLKRGFEKAGFDVEITGYDIEPQPRYPFKFVLADAMDVDLEDADLAWGSPPCQGYSAAQNAPHKKTHPRLIEPLRRKFQAEARMWVIENVVALGKSPFHHYVQLCGAQFGLQVYRHRRFECSHLVLAPPHQRHTVKCQRQGYTPTEGQFMTVTGVGHLSAAAQAFAMKAMGIDWMDGDGLSQAIPPAYSEYLAIQLTSHYEG